MRRVDIQITVDETARSAVAILTNNAPFVGQTLDLTGPAYSNAELAAALTASLGKPVTYVQVPYDAALASFVSSGWPEWQVCCSDPSLVCSPSPLR